MADRKAALRMDIGGVAYHIPALQLAKDATLQSLSKWAVSGDIRVRIEITAPDEATAKQPEQAADRGGAFRLI